MWSWRMTPLALTRKLSQVAARRAVAPPFFHWLVVLLAKNHSSKGCLGCCHEVNGSVSTHSKREKVSVVIFPVCLCLWLPGYREARYRY